MQTQIKNKSFQLIAASRLSHAGYCKGNSETFLSVNASQRNKMKLFKAGSHRL